MDAVLARQALALPSSAVRTGSHAAALSPPGSVRPAHSCRRQREQGFAARSQASPGTGLSAGSARRATRGSRDVVASALGPLQPLLGIFGGVGKAEKREDLKQELLDCIAPLQRGVIATEEDQEVIEAVSIDSCPHDDNPFLRLVNSRVLPWNWPAAYLALPHRLA